MDLAMGLRVLGADVAVTLAIRSDLARIFSIARLPRQAVSALPGTPASSIGLVNNAPPGEGSTGAVPAVLAVRPAAVAAALPRVVAVARTTGIREVTEEANLVGLGDSPDPSQMTASLGWVEALPRPMLGNQVWSMVAAGASCGAETMVGEDRSDQRPQQTSPFEPPFIPALEAEAGGDPATTPSVVAAVEAAAELFGSRRRDIW